MSEASQSRELFLPYLKDRLCLELGAGNYRPWPWMWCADMAGGSYGPTGGDSQQIRGDLRRMPWLCDNALGALSQSHLFEDFPLSELPSIMQECWRVLEPGGFWCGNMPDEQKYRKHLRDTNMEHIRNLAHSTENFSLDLFKKEVVAKSGPWKVVLEVPELGAYSWCIVLQAIK